MRPDSASPSEKIMNMNRTIMKRNKYSRLTAALLSFLLLLSLIPASVFAADEEDDNTNPPEVKVGWQVSKNGTTIKESTDDTQVVLKNQVNIGADTVATKIPFKQNDKVVFSVNVDPQYAEYTTYEWRHYLMQWNGTTNKNVQVVYKETGDTLSLDGIYAGSNAMFNKYLCTVRCTIDGVTYSSAITFTCSVIGENPLLAPAFCTQPESATYKQDESATPLTVAVDSTSNTDRTVHLVYQWYKADNESDAVTAIEGATTNTYTPATSETGTVYYYCEVQDRYKQSGQTYESDKVCSERAKIQVTTGGFSLPGAGTADDPKLIYTASDLEQIREMVAAGNSFEGYYFRFEDDITLPDGWTPIGCTVDGTNKFDPRKPSEKDNLRAFSGTILGNGKLLTVPKGGRPLLAYVKNATVKDLNIYGEEINGYGLVDGLHGVGFTSSDTFAIIIENVTLKSGTKTLKSGLIGAEVDNDVNGFAGASAAFITTIRNCTIEEGVVIGYDGSQSEIGAFAGRFQGVIENCVSHATVKGVNYVGGIIGSRDNAMGQCTVSKCSFDGAVIASGKFAGGITGAMYIGGGAPNGVKTTIQGCTVSGNVTGTENVGGITGGDRSVNQAWNEYSVTGNTFSGKVSGTKNVGGIIGYYRSLNKLDNIAGNAYLKGCGAEQGIGAVDYVDTSCETHETASGATYFDTSKSLPDIYGVTKENHNRTDDPLGKDASNLTMEVEDATTPICYKLDISGDYKTTYTIGEALDLSGMVCTAHWTMNKADTVVDTKDIEITGFDTNQRGEQTVTLAYGAAKVTITVTVLLPAGKDITVSFALLGDSAHGDSGDKHTLADNNLETWIDTTKVTVSNNATVLDVILAVVGDRFDIKNESGNYIQAITPKDGTELAEFTNGKLSGWMYTLNGVHPNLGVAQQYLNEGDVIVFHYTDDYLKEYEAEQNRTKTAEEVKDKLIIIPRVYTNKPRTKGTGYKGLLHNPNPEAPDDLLEGVKAIRHMHLRVIEETGFFTADEMLYPSNYQYLVDLLSYVAVGARSVENQEHRLVSSGISVPVGMKNPTAGSTTVMLNSIYAAQAHQSFIFRNWEVECDGNPLAHAVMRGYIGLDGRTYPNYHYEHLERLAERYTEHAGYANPAAVIDCNHDNSGKRPLEQYRICKEVLDSCRRNESISKLVKGFMIESYLEDGNQPVDGGVFGKSITDPCLGWEKTDYLIHEIAERI